MVQRGALLAASLLPTPLAVADKLAAIKADIEALGPEEKMALEAWCYEHLTQPRTEAAVAETKAQQAAIEKAQRQ